MKVSKFYRTTFEEGNYEWLLLGMVGMLLILNRYNFEQIIVR